MKMKYKHSITFNNIDENECSKYSYSFGNTKNIEIIISKTGVSISAELDKYYNADTILDSDQYLFADGIKKIFFIYLLKYSVNLEVKSVIIKIQDKEEVPNFNDEGKTPVHSLILGNLSEKLPDTFSNDKIIEHILNTTKSDEDQRVNALYSFVYSKNKISIMEEFIYLWTTLNGMYTWLFKISEDKNKRDTENNKILFLLKYSSLGEETIKNKDKNKIAKEFIKKLKDVDTTNANKKYFESGDVEKELSRQLKKASGEEYKISVYGYL